MLILLFTIICIISVVCSVALGNIEQIGYCVIQGANEAVQLSLVLMGVMTLWSGIMRVLSASGTIRALTALLSPVLRILYPDASKKNNGLNEISAAMTANFFGLGNAATTLSLAAVKKLQENNCSSEYASDDLITFTVLSTSSISFIPTTLIALRYSCGSADPMEIVFPIWICSLCSYFVAWLLCRGFSLFKKRGKEKNLP